jgi:hypothetical protein
MRSGVSRCGIGGPVPAAADTAAAAADSPGMCHAVAGTSAGVITCSASSTLDGASSP